MDKNLDAILAIAAWITFTWLDVAAGSANILMEIYLFCMGLYLLYKAWDKAAIAGWDFNEIANWVRKQL